MILGKAHNLFHALYKWQWNQYLDKATQGPQLPNCSIDFDYTKGWYAYYVHIININDKE